MSPMRLIAALALSSTLLLAGCGGSDSSDDDKKPSSDGSAATSTAQAATGEKQTTDAFSFSAPDGWEHNDQAAPTALAFAYDPQDNDGFADNVNVIEDKTLAGAGAGDIERGAKASLESADAEDITVGDPITIDGVDAVTITSTFNLNGNKYAVLQYAVPRDDTGYVITFSYSLDRPESEQAEIAESVAASWKWAS